MKIPVNINLEVEGHGSMTIRSVDIDTHLPLAEQLITALSDVDFNLEAAVYPKRYAIGQTYTMGAEANQ